MRLNYLKRPATRPTMLKLLGLISVLVVSSCQSLKNDLTLEQNPRPKCTWSIWAARPEMSDIRHQDDGATIKTDDPKFKNFICMTYEDLENFGTCGGTK